MNTIRSVGYGWGFLIVAGAGSYYFAKRSINSDREERALANEKQRIHTERMRAQEAVSRDVTMEKSIKRRAGGPSLSDDHPSPSREAAEDPAPTTHQDTPSKSRFEAAEPFRSRKGDRFS